jgi:DNA mismatch endonuclease (patch repair protein)
MVDFLTKTERSALMARVRSRGNLSTEVAVARMLRVGGVSGWRRHLQIVIDSGKRGGRVAGRGKNKRMRVRPDFVFVSSRVALFVDGCFWHWCPKHRSSPAQNAEFWRHKFASNVRRDRRVTCVLRRHGWIVVRIWEHDVRQRPQHCVQRVRKALGNGC